MSKHTPGPWHRVSTREQSGFLITANGAYGGICSGEDKANANLISAAPDLLEALEGLLDNERQSSFEYWLSVKSPSGDCDSVHSQWLESGEYHDFLDLYDTEISAIARAKGESS